MHLDLATGDRGSAVVQAVSLGASLVEEHPHHTWLRDPEGNDFCLVED